MQQPSETVSVTLAPAQRVSQSGSGYSVVVGAAVVLLDVVESVIVVEVIVEVVVDGVFVVDVGPLLGVGVEISASQQSS